MANDEKEIGKHQEEIQKAYRQDGLRSKELHEHGKRLDHALKKRDEERRSK